MSGMSGQRHGSGSPRSEPVATGEPMTGASSVVRSLEALDVDVVFGIPGGAILPCTTR